MSIRLLKKTVIIYKPIFLWNVAVNLLLSVFFILNGFDEPGMYFIAGFFKLAGWSFSVAVYFLFYQQTTYFFQKSRNNVQKDHGKPGAIRPDCFHHVIINHYNMQKLFIDSVNHWFGDREILSSVHVQCSTGETVGLLGRNGSGKSTLLKIIFGSIKPHFKHLKINGNIYGKGFLSRNVSYLPQENFIPDQINVSEAIRTFCKSEQTTLARIELVSKNLNSRFYNLSGGERRFLECLLMIYSDSQYVLLDEPFSQLSPRWVEELKMHINHVKSSKGFIITDHYYKSILDVSDRIVLIHNKCNYTIETEDDLIVHGYLPGFTM